MKLKRILEIRGDALALACMVALLWMAFVIGHGLGW